MTKIKSPVWVLSLAAVVAVLAACDSGNSGEVAGEADSGRDVTPKLAVERPVVDTSLWSPREIDMRDKIEAYSKEDGGVELAVTSIRISDEFSKLKAFGSAIIMVDLYRPIYETKDKTVRQKTLYLSKTAIAGKSTGEFEAVYDSFNRRIYSQAVLELDGRPLARIESEEKSSAYRSDWRPPIFILEGSPEFASALPAIEAELTLAEVKLSELREKYNIHYGRQEANDKRNELVDVFNQKSERLTNEGNDRLKKQRFSSRAEASEAVRELERSIKQKLQPLSDEMDHLESIARGYANGLGEVENAVQRVERLVKAKNAVSGVAS